MIIAKELAANIPQHPVFAKRGYSGLTQSSISEVLIEGKPTCPQLAYSGYKDNIEAFLYATAVGQKTAVDKPYYSIPDSFIPTIPLPYPKVIFQPRKPLDGTTLKRFQVALAKYNFQEHHRGKRTILYSLDHAPPHIVIGKIAPICEKDIVPIGGYCSLEGYFQAAFLHKAVDLFLSVNSYPGFRSEEDGEDEGSVGFQHYDLEGKMKKRDMKIRIRTVTKKIRASTAEIDAAEDDVVEEDAMDLDEEEAEEYFDEMVPIYEEVLSAKPSPLPSNMNYGPPRECPFLPGLVFEYFPGMIKPDPTCIRITVINRFFRLLGDPENSAKAGWRVFKRTINSFANTEEGLVMAHILKGIDLSLQTQTQLFVLIDHGSYLGFVLLGARFSVFSNSTWYKPVSAEKLTETLKELVTHESALEKIAELFGRLDLLVGGKKVWSAEMINTPAKMALGLGQLKFLPDEESVEIHGEIGEGLERVNFPTKYKGISPETVMWAILMMTTLKAKPIDDETPIFFPTGNLELFARREFQILCCFGPRGPKLFASSGALYRIPLPSENDPMSQVDPNSKDKKEIRMPMIIIGTGPPTQCLIAWDQVVKKRSIRFEGLERSKESRCYTFRGKQRDEIWAALRHASESFPAPEASNVAQKGKGKEIFKGPTMDAADVDFSDL